MADSSTRYSFESAPTRHTLLEATDMTEKLLARLGVTSRNEVQLSNDDERTLLAFTTACHLNISWYDKARKRQRRLYWSFVVFTALVVTGMPIALFVADRAASDALTAHIGVIITGLLGGHRMLATMFEKRNLERHFWKAQAELKSILYALEDKWRNCTQCQADSDDPNHDHGDTSDAPHDHGDTAHPHGVVKRYVGSTGTPVLEFEPAFLTDVEDATKRALEVKGNEQDEFFSRSDGAFSNISEILGVLHRQGSKLVEDRQQERKAKAASRKGLADQVTELEAIYSAIEAQMATLERELDTLMDPKTPREQDRQRVVVSTLDGLRRRKLDLEIDLAAARTKLSNAPH